jgi:hypothetical protein
MQNGDLNEEKSEQKLIKLYMDLTGTGEAAARSVVEHVCAEHADGQSLVEDSQLQAWKEKQENQPATLAGQARS